MAGGELDTALDLARLATTEVRAGAKKHAPAWLKQLLCTKQQHSDNAIMNLLALVCIVNPGLLAQACQFAHRAALCNLQPNRRRRRRCRRRCRRRIMPFNKSCARRT